MKYCKKCNLNVDSHLTYCPLCQRELVTLNDKEGNNPFPDTYETLTSHYIILKIIGFIAITVSILAIVINLLTPGRIWWSLIVAVSAGCVWLSLAAVITKHHSILKYMLYQSIILCLFALFLDYMTGFDGWSITFVLPTVFTLAMIIMYLLSKILHLQAGDYVIYLLLDAIFAVLPFLFLKSSRLMVRLPSIICIVVAIISVTSLIIFEGKTIREELDRRLHM